MTLPWVDYIFRDIDIFWTHFNWQELHRNGWSGPGRVQLTRTRIPQSQKETLTWRLWHLSQEKEYALRLLSHLSMLTFSIPQSNVFHFANIYIYIPLNVFAGDSAVRAGKICTNCEASAIPCTHDIPRQPKVTFIIQSLNNIQPFRRKRMLNWRRVDNHNSCRLSNEHLSSYIKILEERLEKMELLLHTVGTPDHPCPFICSFPLVSYIRIEMSISSWTCLSVKYPSLCHQCLTLPISSPWVFLS